jgi:hypothetical protein
MPVFSRNDFSPKPGEYRDKYPDPQNTLSSKLVEGQIIDSLKKKVKELNESEGTLTCPKCSKNLLFAWIPETDLFVFKCSTEGCIDIDETEH